MRGSRSRKRFKTQTPPSATQAALPNTLWLVLSFRPASFGSIRWRTSRNLSSLTPRICINCSGRLNTPCVSRNSILTPQSIRQCKEFAAPVAARSINIYCFGRCDLSLFLWFYFRFAATTDKQRYGHHADGRCYSSLRSVGHSRKIIHETHEIRKKEVTASLVPASFLVFLIS